MADSKYMAHMNSLVSLLNQAHNHSLDAKEWAIGIEFKESLHQLSYVRRDLELALRDLDAVDSALGQVLTLVRIKERGY